MAVQVNPITQSLPATTAIQDPAVRRFAQAVDDALRALRSEEGAVESLKKAADAMNGAIAGGTPPSIAQWLFSSELYQKLTTEIARIDVEAKQDVLNEALARSQAIQEIQAALAEIESTPAYDPATTYQIGDLVTYDNKLYRAKAETTGNLPTNTTYWDKVGDCATLGDVVAAHTLQLSEIESDITDIGGDLAAEITARDTLATQLRGTYAGTDVAMVSQGLFYSERQARVTADGVTVSNLNALRAQVGVTEEGALTTGLILDEKNVRASNDLAIVSAVNTALAQITGVSTSISQSGENLIANWSQAHATKWSQIESEVLTSGGQTIRAALLQESQTRANADGSLGAQWTLKTDINGYISGFGFASTANNATPTSEFIVRADKFAVVMPGYGNHVPFAIGPSGAEFTGLTSWGNVTGSGKPENGATVGADSSNLRAGPGVNMVFNGDYTDGLAGTVVGWRSAGNQHTLSRNLSSYIVQGEGTAFIMQPGTPGAGVVFDANIWNGQEGQYFAVTPGKKYEISAWLNCHRCEGRMSVLFLDAAGTQLQQSIGNAVTHQSSINSIADMRQSWAIVTAPATAVKAVLIVRGYNTGLNDPYVFFSRVYFGEAGAGQTEPSLWTPGRGISQITTSNVTTYIANAAIGNAQIGGDIYSDLWNSSGNTQGWYLQRNGNLYAGNAYIRGNVEASSLKANTLMVNRANIVNAAVDTLQIEGNAVTIPVHSRRLLVYVTVGGWTSLTTAWINAEGSTVSIFASASVSTTTLVSAQNVSIRVLSPSGLQIGRNVISLRDGLYSAAFLITSSTEAGTYTLQIYKSGPTSTLSVEDISLFLIGTKR